VIIVAGIALSGSGDDAPSTPRPQPAAVVAPTTTTGPTAAETSRNEATLVAVRNLARDALADLEKQAPPADAGLHDLLAARSVLERGVEEMEGLAAKLDAPDAQVAMLVARGRSTQSVLGRRIETAAEKLAIKPISVSRKFLDTGHHERAARALENMPSGLSETSWGPRWAKAKERATTALREHLVGKARHRDEGWTYVFTGESLSGWRRLETMQIDIVKDEIDYRILALANPGSEDASVCFAAPGADKSKSYRIRFDVRGVVGDLGICVLGPTETGNASGIRIPGERLPRTDGWWTVQIDMNHGHYRIYLDSRKISENGNARGIVGAFGLRLRAQGKAQVRNVRIKFDR